MAFLLSLLEMKRVSLTGRDVHKFLNGFLCIYKPKDVSVSALHKIILNNICKEANELDEVLVPEMNVPVVEPHARTGALLVVGMRKQLDYIQHPLVSGRVFRREDIQLEALNKLESSSSGVCLFGVNDGCEKLDEIRERAWLNEYHIHATLGIEKYHHEIRGGIVAKAKYEHVTEHRLHKLLIRLKFQYKRLSFELANVERGSQEAFELARRGAPRARLPGTPVVYDISLRQFQTPHIVMNMQVTAENCYFIRAFVHEIGCSVETLACPRRIRRIRQGPFLVEHALLDKHLSLVPILKNIQMCNKIVRTAMARDADVIEIKKSDDLDSKNLLKVFGLKDELSTILEPEDCLRIPWGRHYN